MEENANVGTVPTENAGEPVTATENAGETKTTTSEKVFTQAEVDELFQKRVAKERAKIEKEFETQKENWKKEVYDTDLENKLRTISDELSAYKNKEELYKQSVLDEFHDYVSFKVQKMVTAEKDFSKALSEFASEDANKKYFKTSENTQPKIQMPRPTNTNMTQNGIDGYVQAKYGDVKPLNGGRN